MRNNNDYYSDDEHLDQVIREGLNRLYGHVVNEPVPQDIADLAEQLKQNLRIRHDPKCSG